MSIKKREKITETLCENVKKLRKCLQSKENNI